MDCTNVCRLCLAQNIELYDIFATSGNSEFTFIGVVKAIAPETLENDDACDDHFSTNICTLCMDACNDFIAFKCRIQTSHSYQKTAIRNENKSSIDVQESIVIEYIEDEQLIDVEDDVLDKKNVELDINSATDIFASEDISLSELATAESDEEVTKEEINLSCSKCGKAFHNEHKLKEHCNSHSAKARIYPCPICKRKFTSAVLLMRHEIIHSELITPIKHETRNRCIICNAVFEEKPTLEDHIREHKIQVEKEAVGCLYCDKTFSKLNTLLRHLKSHEENKTHLCNVCNKTFAMGQELVDHLNRHKGFLPHSCHICSKSYLQASKLKNHLKTHANDKVS